MNQSHISTKILLVIVSVSFIGMGILIGAFAYLLNRDYQQQYDANLQYYMEESARRLTADIRTHGDAVQLLTEQLQTDLLLQQETADYWNVQQRSNFLKERRRVDLYSAVFVPQQVPLNPTLMDEITRTHDAWEKVYGSFDRRMMSASYISDLGFIRTQPSHRVAFFPLDYDPRASKLYRQSNAVTSVQQLLVDYDPLNGIYVLSVVQAVVPGGNRSGVVAGVFELPFQLSGEMPGDNTAFKPFLMLVDSDFRLLANPLDGESIGSEVERLGRGAVTAPNATGQVQIWTLDNTLYRVLALPLEHDGWRMLALYPESFLVQRISEMEATLISILLFGAVIVILCANVALRRHVVKPLQLLTNATRAISHNHWHFQPPNLPRDEIGELSTVIDTLATELRTTLGVNKKTITSLDNMSRSLSTMYSTLDASDNMTAILEADWRVIYANEKFLEVFPGDCVNRNFLDCYSTAFSTLAPDYFDNVQRSLDSDGAWTNEIRVLDAQGIPRSYLEKIVCHTDPDGELVSLIYNAHALFQGAENVQQIERLAYYDHLTGLQNRTFFKGVMEEELASLKRSESMLSLLYIDLDNFKTINDSLGHEAGDALLVEVAKRLKDCLRTDDAVARIGGDEFAVLIKDVDALHYVSIVANKIIQALNLPLYLQGQMVSIGASIGVTVAPDDADQVMELMKNADLAMYQAKEKGRNNFRFYTQDMNREVSRRMEIESEIKQALENQEFILHYQPKIHLHSGRVDAAEALVRWRLPNGDIRGPQEFIPAAEDCGLIMDLGLWVLRSACQQAKTLYKALRQEVVISVNVSAQQLTASDFVHQVEQALNDVGLKPSLLELEITESLFMTNLDQTIEHLDAIRRLGVRISIDDFGTGYSSLSYLKRLPIDQLKVDRSFIRDLPGDEDDRVITELIVAMAKQLKLEVVAEGVETPEQHRYLDSLGCDYAQGYRFAKPLPPDEFMVFVFEASQKPKGALD